MTIRLTDQTIFLEGVCAVEDAELMIQHLQGGAAQFDWANCSHLHAACLQVLLAAGVPVQGTPDNPELARWLVPVMLRLDNSAPPSASVAADLALEMES
jgi:hypothetical protein